MATYVNDLRLKEIGTGESSGTWGTETNVNLELIGEALGYGTEAITTNADTHTTTVADGATDPGRAMYIKYTGTLDSACTITIGPNTINRLHYIENATSGSQNIIISQGSGANITIPAGDTKAVYLDGAGSGAAVVDVFASFSAVDLKVQDDLTVTDDATIGGTLGVTGILTCTDDIIIGDGKTIGSASDVDAMTIASNGQVTFTQTLIGTALDISGDIDIDGTANLDVVDIDGAVDMASTLTLAGNADFNGDLDVDGTANLDVVDIDGAVDMASTLTLAGNADFNGDLDVDGTTNLDVVDIDGAVDMASTLQVDGSITSSDGMTITTADNSDTLTLTSTDADASVGPNLVLYRNSSSPADADLLGQIKIVGRNDNSQDVVAFQMQNYMSDVSDGSEDASVYFYVMAGGAVRERIGLNPTSLVINEDSQDLDVRIESNNNANMVFLDSGNDVLSVGYGGSIQVAGERHELQVFDTNFSVISAATFRNGSDGASISLAHSRSGTIGTQTILQDGDTLGAINFLGSDGTDMASFGARIHAEVDGTPGSNDMPGRLIFATTPDGATGSVEAMRVDNSQDVLIGTTSAAAEAKVHIEVTPGDPNAGSPTSSSALMVNGGTTTVGSGPILALRNISGSKETIARIAAETVSGNNGDLTVSVYAGGSTIDEKIRVQSGGGISFNGDTAAANALDDYEEGTWTPVFKDLSGTAFGQSTSLGSYVKIGRWVQANFQITVNSVSGLSGSYVHLTGIPFNHPTSAYNGTGMVDYHTNLETAVSKLAFDTSSTATVFWLVGVAAAGGVSSIYIPPSYFGGNETVKGSVIYFTSV